VLEFKLPDLGEGIHEGELLKWYTKVGDEIKEDDPLCDVETDKAAVTIPSPFTGKVAALYGEIGDTLHVGNVIFVVDDGSGGSLPVAPGKEEPKAEAPAPAEEPKAEPKLMPEAPVAKVPGRVAAAPATRRLAREMGIDIKLIHGTGPGGRVTPQDVKNFAEGGAPKEEATFTSSEAPADFENASIPFFEVAKLPDFEDAGPVEREPVRSIRRKVAVRTTSSMIMVPHVAHMDECDVTKLEEFRLTHNEKNRDIEGATKLTLMPFVVKAVASLLKKYPMFNASLDPHRQEIIYKKYYNMGFAADTPRGLIVPVVKDADRKSIVDVAAEISALANKGREGKIEAGDMKDGTFSITNVGPIGGTGLIPTINYPEVAILGMGRVQEKPVVRDGEIVIRKILPLTLAFDHRVADGAQAATFTTELIKRLSDPNVLLLEN
jgi:pyruvate dehydrogenase E2 component (dihydrolipoamide acetyltransferase)